MSGDAGVWGGLGRRAKAMEGTSARQVLKLTIETAIAPGMKRLEAVEPAPQCMRGIPCMTNTISSGRVTIQADPEESMGRKPFDSAMG